jgi:hypothetical protein
MIKEIASDIFLIKNVLTEDFCDKINIIRNHSSRIDLIEFPETLKYFKDYWFDTIEKEFSDYFFSNYDLNNNLGLNASEYTLIELKKYVRTRFRNIYTLRYTFDNSQHEPKNIHWDFSNYTFVGCISNGYEGGELNFPMQNTNIKIEKGDVVFFPGGLTHPHFVNIVNSGIRDVFVVQTLPYSQGDSTYEELNG